MYKILFDTFFDTIIILPFLFVIYIGIELVEYKFGKIIRETIQKAGSAGPALGAITGSLPQCGFSVITTALYNERLVTLGTLIAVYLSTSDEAIPVILSQPDKTLIIIPLILTKIFVALIAGYFIDLVLIKKNRKILKHIENAATGKDESSHHHEKALEEKACCGHMLDSSAKKFHFKQVILHPIIHTLKIFIFIFIVSLIVNYSISLLSDTTLQKIFLENSLLQPVIAALIGLIPNCASSVTITELFLKGVISYGSVIAGLCASGGLGILILFKEEKNKLDFLKIIALLFAISSATGIIIELILK